MNSQGKENALVWQARPHTKYTKEGYTTFLLRHVPLYKQPNEQLSCCWGVLRMFCLRFPYTDSDIMLRRAVLAQLLLSAHDSGTSVWSDFSDNSDSSLISSR